MTERISDAEHAVMEVLWKRAPLTATEVADQVTDEKDWSLQTVKTLSVPNAMVVVFSILRWSNEMPI